jgi:hypothetical protein
LESATGIPLELPVGLRIGRNHRAGDAEKIQRLQRAPPCQPLLTSASGPRRRAPVDTRR